MQMLVGQDFDGEDREETRPETIAGWLLGHDVEETVSDNTTVVPIR